MTEIEWYKTHTPPRHRAGVASRSAAMFDFYTVWDRQHRTIEDASIIHSPKNRRPLPLEEPDRLDGQGPRVRYFFKTTFFHNTKRHVFDVEEDALDLRRRDRKRYAGHADVLGQGVPRIHFSSFRVFVLPGLKRDVFVVAFFFQHSRVIVVLPELGEGF